MKYSFSIQINGEIDDKTDDDQPENMQDLHQIVMDSFPYDLRAGVTVTSMNISTYAIPPMDHVSTGVGVAHR